MNIQILSLPSPSWLRHCNAFSIACRVYNNTVRRVYYTVVEDPRTSSILTLLMAVFDLQQPFDVRLHHIMVIINATDTNAAIPTANSMSVFMRKI